MSIDTIIEYEYDDSMDTMYMLMWLEEQFPYYEIRFECDSYDKIGYNEIRFECDSYDKIGYNEIVQYSLDE